MLRCWRSDVGTPQPHPHANCSRAGSAAPALKRVDRIRGYSLIPMAVTPLFPKAGLPPTLPQPHLMPSKAIAAHPHYKEEDNPLQNEDMQGSESIFARCAVDDDWQETSQNCECSAQTWPSRTLERTEQHLSPL